MCTKGTYTEVALGFSTQSSATHEAEEVAAEKP